MGVGWWKAKGEVEVVGGGGGRRRKESSRMAEAGLSTLAVSGGLQL